MVVIFCNALLAFSLLLSLAFAHPEPLLTRQEQRLYDRWNEEYRMHRYALMLPGANPISSYSHMLSTFPRLEIDSLNWAHTDGNGPYQHARVDGKTYVATTIRGDQGPALRWNLRQNDRLAQDVSVFWRIDHHGPKMLRFDLWPVGAFTPQMVTMQEVMDRIPFRIS